MESLNIDLDLRYVEKMYPRTLLEKICLKITVVVLEVFMHKQSLKIQTYLCWKFKVRVSKNNSDVRKITVAVYLKFIVHMINL